MYQSIGHDNSEKKWAKWGLASSVIANVALAGAVCMVAFGNTEPTLESTAMRVAPQVAPMVHIAPRNVFQGANFRRNLRIMLRNLLDSQDTFHTLIPPEHL